MQRGGIRFVGLMCLWFAACATERRPLPNWLQHIKLPKVDVGATLDRYESRLIGELKSGVYRPGKDTPPEQLAVLAVHELQRDRPWDAAVVLALASYRRCEQSWAVQKYGHEQGWKIADARSDGRIERETYDAFLEQERTVLWQASFDRELTRIATKVGAPTGGGDIDQDVARVINGHRGDSTGAWEAIGERVRTLSKPPPERLQYPQLAAAVREYLRASVQMHRHSYDTKSLARCAANKLSLVPLREFRLASLQRAARAFDSRVVCATTLLYRESPEHVRAALRTNRYASRSTAALALGLIGDPAHVPELRAGWEAEKHSMARLSFASALAVLGEAEHARELEEALRSSDSSSVVAHAAILLAWMPGDLQYSLNESLLREALQRKEAAGVGQYVIITLLRDLSTRRPLGEQTLKAVLSAAAEYRDDPEVLHHFAARIADFEQLDRARVLRAIRSRAEPLEPWLHRFARVVQPDDLPQIERWLSEPAYADAQRLLVQAANAIPRADAQAALERWLLRYPKLDSAVGLSLAIRGNVDHRRLERLLATEGLPAGALYLELALGRVSAVQRLPLFLRSSELIERIDATHAVRMFGKPEHTDVVWENVAYHDARYYPNDVTLRHLSLSALIHVELNRREGVKAEQVW